MKHLNLKNKKTNQIDKKTWKTKEIVKPLFFKKYVINFYASIEKRKSKKLWNSIKNKKWHVTSKE